ncbi:MAG: hypothetical protein ONB48_04925 [candidate division KSB1 bacterium]|nr:hypothetical protein [candidate division KSB1 bacterium]MDZ7274344.1 hypothetical protein [candidate division KSB1 bacterium]MDZ7284994.1 hypothetical protein [candidate division KSB1 bacterium]MDZ7297585.1 hypothetical protein [candidate division KSB1 bacterium]MDZ7348452.1 hypothetical protein [candidate division KSB1 bacterium]
MSVHETYLELQRRLRELRRQESRLLWLGRFGLYIAVCAGMALLAPVLAHSVAAIPLFRWMLTLASLAVVAYATWRLVLQPVLNSLAHPSGALPIDLALRLGKLHPEVHDRFANALQVYADSTAEQGSAVRKALAAAALTRVSEQVKALDFSGILQRTTPRKRVLTGLVAFALCVLAWGAAPGFMFTGATVVLNPHRQIIETATQFSLTPGDVEIVKGEDLIVTARLNHLTTETVQLEWQLQGTRAVNQAVMKNSGSLVFQHKFERVRESLSYRVHLGEETSRWYHVRVIEPPLIRSLQVTIHHPDYTRRPPQALAENLGDIMALPGARASLQLEASKELRAAAVHFSWNASLPLQLSGETARGEFNIAQPGSYTIVLEDANGLHNIDPIQYRIELETDQTPAVRIAFPGQDVDLDESMQLPLTVLAEDDYGFSSAEIVYEHFPSLGGESRTGHWPLPFSDRHQPRLTLQAVWDFTTLEMQPDDVVRYFARVRDNDVVRGPKAAHSQTYQVRFPSLYEIYQEVANVQSETAQDMQELYQQARQVKQKLDDLAQQLKKDPNLDWEQRQKLSETAGASEQMRESLRQMQERLAEMITTMERNDLLSLETLNKYLELQKLLQEINSPELQKALGELRKAMETLDPEKLEEAMKNFQFSQEEFLKGLERTINLLKQLQAEQKLDEALKKTADLQERQQEINEKAAKPSDAQTREQLAAQEKALQRDSEALEQPLQEISSLLHELQQQSPAQKVEQAAQMMQSENLAGGMEQMSESLQQGQMAQAQQQGRRVAQTLHRMREALAGAQKEMRESQQRQAMQALQRSSLDLLQLSKRQEQLGSQAGSTPQNEDMTFNHTADQQQELLSGLRRVAEQLHQTSQKSFAVTPEVARAVGQAMNSMQNALQQLEQRNGRQAATAQRQAMQSLDRAVAGLRAAMQQMSGQPGMGMGMEQFLQRLLGLSGQQQGINQQTEGLTEQGMSALQRQAAMARMAAEQAAVQKSLEQLLQEFGNRGEILGRLDQTVRDMEEVVKDLQQQNVNRQTLERQQQILSRMLDAQRSLRERDHSKERQAERARNYRSIDPGALPDDLGGRRTRMQEDLMNALREKYSRDYRELIQKYFEALTRQQEGEKK